MPQLRAVTTALPNVPNLLKLMGGRTGTLAWLRKNNGFVGAGVAARFDLGPDSISDDGDAAASDPCTARFAAASEWWAGVVENADVRDEVVIPGTGLITMGSFSFDADSPAGSTLIVPQVLVGHRDGHGWLTVIGPKDADIFDTMAPEARALLDAALPGKLQTYADHGAATSASALPEEHFTEAVAGVAARIRGGEVNKVVLARALDIETEADIDERFLVSRLSEGFPSCWTFAVEGLVGATPELLASTYHGIVNCRVLAGTRSAGEGAADELANSAKDLAEHKLAADSVVETLKPLTRSVKPADEPYVLTLPNVVHLASDITGELADDVTSIEVAGALHPTAALGGDPREKAIEIISEVEGLDRDRYGAPVGWMGASRDGQWCVALRCARITGARTARAYAGGGIMGNSDPAAELAETEAKFAAVRGAFGF